MSDQQYIDKFFSDDDDDELYPSIRPSDPKYTFSTPCTRFGRLSLHAEANAQTSNEPLRLDDDVFTISSEMEQIHPNLEMTMDHSKRIIIQSKRGHHDEDQNDGDIIPIKPVDVKKKIKALLDEMDEDEVQEYDPFDTSGSWLNHIYKTVDEDDNNDIPTHNNDDDDDDDDDLSDDQENRPPRNWHPREEKHIKVKKTFVFEDDYNEDVTIPLREIIVVSEDQPDIKEVSRSKKRLIISDGNAQRIRIMRTLSPPRFSTKVKEQQETTV